MVPWISPALQSDKIRAHLISALVTHFTLPHEDEARSRAVGGSRSRTRMPTCTECGTKRGLDDFSDAQICGRGRCLQCSNPRLWAKRLERGLHHRPLSELGRTAGSERPEQELRLPTAAKPAAASVRCRGGCGQLLPASHFSARQLAGKGKCQACAKQASAANLVQQADQVRKRRRDGEDGIDLWAAGLGSIGEPSWQAPGGFRFSAQGDELQGRETAGRETEGDDAEEQYVQELLRGVEEARRAKAQASAARRAAASAELDASNAGHGLLQRLGWEPGTGLGSQQQGALLPAASLLPGQLDKKGLSRADEVPAAEAGDECFTSRPAPVPFVSFSNTTTAGVARE